MREDERLEKKRTKEEEKYQRQAAAQLKKDMQQHEKGQKALLRP